MPEPKALRWQIEAAVKRSDLVADARHVLWVLLSVADVATGVVPASRSPSYGSLARDTNLARSTVILRVRDLERDGWLIVESPDVAEQVSKRARNQYRVCLPTGPSLGLVREPDQSPDWSEEQTSPSPGPALVRGSDSTGPGDGLTTDHADESDSVARASEIDELTDERRALAERVAAFLGDGMTVMDASDGLRRLDASARIDSVPAYVESFIRKGLRDELARKLRGHRSQSRRKAPGPPCGKCEGNDADGVASRLVPGTDTPCPNCHPRGVSRAS